MGVRRVSLSAALPLAAAALLCGCPGDGGRGSTGAPSAKTSPGTKAATSTSTSKKPPAKAGSYGEGVIKGVVKLTGKPPAMIVPAKRKELPFCKQKLLEHNAVLVKDGMLQDAIIAIADGEIEGAYPMSERVMLDQKDCVFEPRAFAVVVDQKIDIRNSDQTVHNVRAKRGTDVLFNIAQPRGGMLTTKSIEDPGIVAIDCDMHPWMHSFARVTDNPFFAVSGADGAFSIERVPDGEYELVAWHSQYGAKNKKVQVAGGEVVVDFVYSGKEPEPPENKGELANLE